MAKTYKITAPNVKYNGFTGDCFFVNGVGETSNEKLLNYFKNNGYKVEETKGKTKSEETKSEE